MQVADASAQGSVDPAMPQMPKRDLAANPLSLTEKAEYAKLLPASFGPLEGGWLLRPFEMADFWALRPDLKPCLVSGFDPGTCLSFRKNAADGLWTYVRGDELIVTSITYMRGRNMLPKGNVRLTPKTGEAHGKLFIGDRAAGEARKLGTRAGFEASVLPKTIAKGGQPIDLHKFHARMDEDGKVVVYVATNTDEETALSVLYAMDRSLVYGLIAAPVMTQAEAIASIADRDTKFDVIGDDALRQKVADMSSSNRNGYVKGIMKDALTNGRRPQDYAITYFAPGDVGLADTLEYLLGRMPDSHPGHKVLTTEHRRSLPVGTCLQTPHKVYCGKKAEYLRIVHEIRRRNHARADIPLE